MIVLPDLIEKVRLNAHCKNLRSFYVRELFLLAAILLFAVYLVPSDTVGTFFLFASVGFVIEVAPALVLVYSYYRHNRGHLFVIDSESITMIDNGRRSRYEVDRIEKVVIHMSKANPRISFAIHSIDLFSFAQVQMKDGANVVITSICAENVDEVLEAIWVGVPLEYKWGFPCLGAAARDLMSHGDQSG